MAVAVSQPTRLRDYRECPLRLGKLAAGATVLAQCVGRRLLQRKAVGFVTPLLEIADKRLKARRIAAVGGQHATGAQVERPGVLARRFGCTLSGYRSALLSARHSVPATAA